MHLFDKKIRLLLAAACLAWCTELASADQRQISSGCLYAVYKGADKEKVEPCAPGDPSNLASDSKVRAAIKALQLDNVPLRFNGCKSARYSAAPDTTPRHYVITYPTSAGGSHIGPITHELAHVMQMEVAGSLEALRQNPSRKIELGADYLTGIVFVQALRDIGYNEFQHNLSLIGLYVELDPNAHGTPSQRTAAFRFGANMKFDEVNRSIHRAHEEFMADVYGQVIQNK
ncbi:MAG: hypothetical protein ABIQ72_05790 [Usitatibacter sp.]